MSAVIPVVSTTETKRLAIKWERQVDKFGFTKVPNALLTYGATLGIDLQEIGFLCVHLRFRYDKRKRLGEDYSKIFPSLEFLSSWRSTDSRSTYSRIRSRLVEKGLIEIITRKEGSDITKIESLLAALCFLIDEDHRIQEQQKDLENEGVDWRFIRKDRLAQLTRNYTLWKQENLALADKEAMNVVHI